MAKKPSIKVGVEITEEAIKGLLCCAFEGGSNDWYRIEKYKYGPGLSAKDFAEDGGKFQGQTYWHPCQLVPLVKGCAVIIADMEAGGKKYSLDREALTKGLVVMAKDQPLHFGNFISERDDATTGDVFLQCCLFGEVLYG
jgi:hypothetical protein